MGIEIDNAGYLSKQGDEYISWFGKSYSPNQVFKGSHRNSCSYKYWHRYTEFQIEIVEEICELLINEYNIKYILGHEEISPGRKFDPGPAFPLDKLRDKLLYSDRQNDSTITPIENYYIKEVTATGLNVRKQPNISSPLAGKALPRGTKIVVINELNSWLYINSPVFGWVKAEWTK